MLWSPLPCYHPADSKSCNCGGPIELHSCGGRRTMTVMSAVSDRAFSEIKRLCYAGLDAETLSPSVVERLRRAVPFDGHAVVTIDPLTGLATGLTLQASLTEPENGSPAGIAVVIAPSSSTEVALLSTTAYGLSARERMSSGSSCRDAPRSRSPGPSTYRSRQSRDTSPTSSRRSG
jgi:hypothetical protein